MDGVLLMVLLLLLLLCWRRSDGACSRSGCWKAQVCFGERSSRSAPAGSAALFWLPVQRGAAPRRDSFSSERAPCQVMLSSLATKQKVGWHLAWLSVCVCVCE